MSDGGNERRTAALSLSHSKMFQNISATFQFHATNSCALKKATRIISVCTFTVSCAAEVDMIDQGSGLPL